MKEAGELIGLCKTILQETRRMALVVGNESLVPVTPLNDVH